MLLFISGPEIFLIVLVVLLLFGSKKIPEMARGMGKGMREFKRATDEIKDEINKSSSDVMNDVRDIQTEINKQDIDSKTDDSSKEVDGHDKASSDANTSLDPGIEETEKDIDAESPGNSGYPDEDLNDDHDQKSRE